MIGSRFTRPNFQGRKYLPQQIAMVACIEKLGQPLAHFRTETCLTKADRIKTDLQRIVSDPVSWFK
jgi:hypothetical protein